MAKTLTLSIALAGMLLATPAHAASLLTNGGFETTDTTPGQISPFTPQNLLPYGGWNVYPSMPGWTSTSPTGFELQRETITITPDGDNYIELESHPQTGMASNIRQSFNVVDPGIYTLSFIYQPRPDTDPNLVTENLINVIFGGVTTAISAPPYPFGSWSTIVIDALLAAGTNILEFNAFSSNNNTLGGFIDAVSVDFKRQAPEVPLPAGLLLLLTGLGGLGFLSRSRSKVA